MSKPAIDELLDTVSGCDMDDPRFGARYGGNMDDEEFLIEVDDYVIWLQERNVELVSALEECLDVMEDGHCSNTKAMARKVLAKAKGDAS